MSHSRCGLVLVPCAVLAIAATGCNAPSSLGAPTGPTRPVVGGGATIQGTVLSGTGTSRAVGLGVSVVGTALSTSTDSRGQFTLGSVPSGEALLHFESPGVSANLKISGLVDGQVRVVTVRVSGTGASEEPEPAPEPSPSSDPPGGPDGQQGPNDQQGQ
jgi:hypothetical protein